MSIPKTAILVGCVVAALLAMTAGIESGRAGDAPSSPAVDGATPPANNPDDQPTAGQVDARIAALIEQLGDAEYRVRQKAQDELSKYSFEAFDALNAATTHDDLEIATRARYLLGLMRVDWDSKDDPPEVQEVLKDYQRQPIREKVSRIASGIGKDVVRQVAECEMLARYVTRTRSYAGRGV